MGWFFLGIGIALVIVILLCVWIVGPTETGIVVRLGKPIRAIGSGIHLLLPRGIDGVVKFPTRQYMLDFSAGKVITKKGEYPPDSKEMFEAALISVDSTVYFRWPGNNDLIKAYRSAPPPSSTNLTLKEFFEDAVISALRMVVGEMTWRQAVENRDQIRTKVLEELKKEGNPFSEAGITNISVVIEEIKLPEALEQVLTIPQQEELMRRGIEQEAEAERIFTVKQGMGYDEVVRRNPIAALLTFFATRKTPSRK